MWQSHSPRKKPFECSARTTNWKIAKNIVLRILIDDEISTDLIFKIAPNKMNLEGAILCQAKTLVYDFSGEQVEAEGMITLPVTMGEAPAQLLRMINFLMVDHQSIYNAIIGWPTINDIRAITSKLNYHLVTKFPTDLRSE